MQSFRRQLNSNFSVSISWKLVYQSLPLSGEVCEEQPCDQNKFHVNVLSVRMGIFKFLVFSFGLSPENFTGTLLANRLAELIGLRWFKPTAGTTQDNCNLA